MDFTRHTAVLQPLSRFPWKHRLPVCPLLTISDSYTQPLPQLTSNCVSEVFMSDILIFPASCDKRFYIKTQAAHVSAQERQET